MAKKFNIYGQTITISDGYEHYNTMLQQFKQAAQEAAQEIELLYDRYGGIKKVLDNIFDDGMKIINDVIDNLVINEFIKSKIYDIDTKTFFSNFCKQKYFVWGVGVQQISDKYKEIYREIERNQPSEKPLSYYRRAPSEPGLATKALKSATEAGVRNSTPGGVAHTLLSAMDSYVSSLNDPAEEERRIAAEARALKIATEERQREEKSRGISREMKFLYDSSSTKEILRSAMYDSVFVLHAAVWEVLSEYKCVEILDFMSDAAMEKAKATINNFQRMSREDVLKIFPQTLLLNPYNKKLYKAMYSLFEDSNGELAVLARYFIGDDASFIRSRTESYIALARILKEKIAKKLFSEINTEFEKSEQLALEAKEKFSLALKSNGVEDTQSAQECLESINNILKDFDLKARTFDGIVFDTREEAQGAREKKNKEETERIDEYLSGLDYKNSETDARKALTKLQSYPTAFMSTVKPVLNIYINEILNIIHSFEDIKARTIKFNDQAIVLETKERVKEFSEFQKIYSAYTDEKAETFPKAGLQKIFELLNKMPEEIKSFYFEKLSDFEKKQRSIGLTPKFILFCIVINFGIGIASLVFAAHNWNNWKWLGAKGVFAMFLLCLPAFSVSGGQDSNDYKSDFSMLLGFFLWDIAFLKLSVPEYSWMGLTVVTLALIGIVNDLLTKKKRAKKYVSDFDKYSLQSKEYIKFKEVQSK